jgi:hypothetical protein
VYHTWKKEEKKGKNLNDRYCSGDINIVRRLIIEFIS